MNKLNNTKIKYGMFLGLLVLAVLAFGLTPLQTHAQVSDMIINGYGPGNPVSGGQYYNGYTNGYCNNSYNNCGQNYYPYYYINNPPAQTTTDYSYIPTIYSTNGTATGNKNKTVTTTKNTTINNTKTNTGGEPTDVNGLAANALYGSNGFMPSGIIGWILFAILILLIIILTRRVAGHSENYQATPMKHD